MAQRPLNALLITIDEEGARIPHPSGFALPAHERLAVGGVAFANYYGSSTMCSSSRSVMCTGRHVLVTEIYDNDDMTNRPLDPGLGTLGTMMRTRGYYTAVCDTIMPRPNDRRTRHRSSPRCRSAAMP